MDLTVLRFLSGIIQRRAILYILLLVPKFYSSGPPGYKIDHFRPA